MENKARHIVISGTYSTGKTTTTTALSIATGIPMIDALSAREILITLYPGRRFQDMSMTELLALGLYRFKERIKAETSLVINKSDFISDGSVLNEWIYGTVRTKIGINPGAVWYQQFIKFFLGLNANRFMKKYLNGYGTVVNDYAKKSYTEIIHLPIEFDMDTDGHRPVSEKYRQLSNKEIFTAYKQLDISMHIVGGTLEERIDRIIKILNCPQIVNTKDAIRQANEVIIKSRETVSNKIIEQYHKPTFIEKFKILSRF
ncbi:AAA family ATPase [Leuconostoc gelidum subsp. gasicomitatum]|uniref:AAA family ATPase n=2 Tax=Leuconostoc gasicomitatum TaxID=115778 RepID=UPI001CC7579D|nr:AAA family ATPase [Leuconostoc gasicomitatum]MBZ5953176.1 AAA family ATPase [Leuconostoc gasicomitatum]MBZ5988566.1 AAA family ATPase [Leuconostoc gasicomitatum]MBZ5990831.1 AAA family ATPase [Leuconostoc gasicomitatum]